MMDIEITLLKIILLELIVCICYIFPGAVNFKTQNVLSAAFLTFSIKK